MLAIHLSAPRQRCQRETSSRKRTDMPKSGRPEKIEALIERLGEAPPPFFIDSDSIPPGHALRFADTTWYILFSVFQGWC